MLSTLPSSACDGSGAGSCQDIEQPIVGRPPVGSGLAEERQQLTDLSTKGTAAAATLTCARILLKADASPGGPDWTEAQIAEALDTSLATIHRVRETFVTEGLDRALQRRRPTGRTFRKLDGAQEAHLIAVASNAHVGVVMVIHVALTRWLPQQPRWEGGPLGQMNLSPIAQALACSGEGEERTPQEAPA